MRVYDVVGEGVDAKVRCWFDRAEKAWRRELGLLAKARGAVRDPVYMFFSLYNLKVH